MTDKDKILDKLAKIKRHMESAQAIGNEQEAQAFAAALQTMLLNHKLEMTDVEYASEMKDEPIVESRPETETVAAERDDGPRYYTVGALCQLDWKDLPYKVRRFLVDQGYSYSTVEEWEAFWDAATPERRYEVAHDDEGVGMREFPSEKWYPAKRKFQKHFYKDAPDVEVRRVRVHWIEQLGATIAKFHSCSILVNRGSSNVWFVGHKSNVAVCEFLFVTLLRAAEKLADKAYAVQWRAMTEAGDVTRCRGFRASFLEGFVQRLFQRFQEELAAVEHNTSSTALVRVNREAIAVREYLDKKKTGSAPSTTSRLSNRDGYAAGKRAADGVNLRPRVVNAGRPNQQLTD